MRKWKISSNKRHGDADGKQFALCSDQLLVFSHLADFLVWLNVYISANCSDAHPAQTIDF